MATITDADNKTAQKSYYRTGLLRTETDRRNNTTTYEYDALGRVSRVTDALNQTVATTYDAVGNVLTVTDKRDIVTEHTYDDFSRLTQTQRAATRLITNEYDDAGNLTAVIDANDNRTEHTYNQRNLKTAATFADATTNAFTYDNNANLLTATDEAGQVTAYAYDQENRQTSVTFANETTQYEYDPMGRKSAEIKPEGNRRAFAYNLLGQLRQVTDDPNGVNLATRYEYDPNGNLRHQFDARDNHVEYTYDNLNRKTAHIQHKDTGNLTVAYNAYDAEGNLTQMTDAMGRVFAYAYDALNRRTQTSAPDLGALFQTLAVATTYDANNNITGVTETKTDDTGATFTDQSVSTYDDFDRPATTTQRGLLTTYGYDPNGNRTSVATPAGATAYTFDSRNRLRTATADSQVTTYTYYPDGKKETVTYPNGTVAGYDYTAADRIQSITHTRSADSSLISDYSYTYDHNGNRTQQIEVQNSVTETTDYAYDDLDRLTQYTVTGAQTTVTAYTYEAYNRETETVTTDSVLTKERAYTYDQTDWLTRIDDTTDAANPFTIAYTYDNNGNTLTKQNSSLTNQDETFAYNALNRLVETRRGPPAAQTILGRYDYNAAGLRVRHHLSERGDVNYYYDDTAVIEERNASDDTLLAHYRYADRLISLDTGAALQYYHHDALGSTVNLTTATAAVQVSYKLDPWGHVREQVGESVNRQIFTGQEHDTNTGLIYFGARYYDPDTARFITQDTYLGESRTPPSLHRYMYAYANPTVYIDLTGNNAFSEWAQERLETFRSDQKESTKGLNAQRKAAYDTSASDTTAVVKGTAISTGAAVMGIGGELIEAGATYVKGYNLAEDLFLSYNPVTRWTDAGKEARNNVAKARRSFKEGVKNTVQAIRVTAENPTGTAKKITKSVAQYAEKVAEGDTEYTGDFAGKLFGIAAGGEVIEARLAQKGKKILDVVEEMGDVSASALKRSTVDVSEGAAEIATKSTFRDASGRLRNADGTFAYDGGSKRVPNPTHGNTKTPDTQATLYGKFDKDDNFLKWGKAQNPNTRYTNTELDGGYVKPYRTGPTDQILDRERRLVERFPGPDNNERWAGWRNPSHQNYRGK